MLKRALAAAAALIISGAAAAFPNVGRAQSGPAWLTFHGAITRSGVSSANGPKTGTVANRWSLTPREMDASPVVEGGGKVFIADCSGAVFGVSTSSPTKPIWHTIIQTEDIPLTECAVQSAPSLSPDGATLYLASSDAHVYALKTSDGTQLWAQDVGAPVHGSPSVSPDGSKLYIGTVNGIVTALNTTDGSAAWSKFQPITGTIAGSLALSPDGSTIYTASALNAEVYAMPASGPGSGNSLQGSLVDGPVLSTPSVDNSGNVYVTTTQGSLEQVQIGQPAGKALWTAADHRPSASTPALAGGMAIFGDGPNVEAVNISSGNVAWAFRAGGDITSSPAVATGNNMVYVGSEDGSLYGLDLQTGTEVFQKLIGSPIIGSPAIGPDGSVWLSAGGSLYRLADISTPPPPIATVTPGGRVGTATPKPVPTTPPGTSTFPTPVSNVKATLANIVKPGAKQKITVDAPPNTLVHFRIQYPNGDHQSGQAKANAQGKAVYSFTQGSSKITHNNFNATVIIRVGDGVTAQTTTKSYKIMFGAIDVSAEPRVLAVGQVVDIFVHSKSGTHVIVHVLSANTHGLHLRGTTGPKGFASMKYTVSAKLKGTGATTKVTVQAYPNGHKPNISASSFFTIH